MTEQKRLVYEIVSASCDHPSAETVYLLAKERMPSIAMGTVYRNLGILVDEGLIHRIAVANAPDRFDGCVKNHAHISCRECGKIVDLPAFADDASLRTVEEESSFSEITANIRFTGICGECRAKRKNQGV